MEREIRDVARRLAAVAAVATWALPLCVVASVGRAAADGDEPDPATAAVEDALRIVTEELAHLVRLGWIAAPVPSEALELAAVVDVAGGAPVDSAARLVELDGTLGPAALARLRALGLPVGQATATVLVRNLPPPSSRPARVGAAPYVRARGELEGLVDPGTAGAVDTAGAAAASAASRGETSDAAPGAVLAALLAGSVGLVAGVAWWWSRRRAVRATPDRRELAEAVLDTGRRVLAASDLDDFGGRAVVEVARLTNARGAVLGVDDRTWREGRLELDPADVERVRSTGRSIRRRDVMVVPVIVGGHVRGVLAASGADDRAERVLDELALLLGAAHDQIARRADSEELALVDGLTRVGNRRRFDRDLCRLLHDGAARPTEIAVAMIDVDHFKQVNDRFGHQVGDDVLRSVAETIAANVRAGDLVYRYGGEEFAVLLPGADLAEATAVVERIRAAVEAVDAGVGAGPVTVSAGISASPRADGTAMLRAADAALYEAKAAGRNRVVAAAASP